jgi:hypothetical protein
VIEEISINRQSSVKDGIRYVKSIDELDPNDRPFCVINKDSGDIFDIRDDKIVARIGENKSKSVINFIPAK